MVRAEPLGSEAEAERWVESLRGDAAALDAEVDAAVHEINRLVRAHRAVASDPYVSEVHPDRALAVRVGHGTGAQVADGQFTTALEQPRGSDRRRRAERLAPQERLAEILGGRVAALACDELVLRARADLNAGRPREASLQARIALECVLEELDPERLGGLRTELEADRASVIEAAGAALAGEPPGRLREQVASTVERMERALRRHRARVP